MSKKQISQVECFLPNDFGMTHFLRTTPCFFSVTDKPQEILISIPKHCCGGSRISQIGGANSREVCANPIFCENVAKTCIEICDANFKNGGTKNR